MQLNVGALRLLFNNIVIDIYYHMDIVDGVSKAVYVKVWLDELFRYEYWSWTDWNLLEIEIWI